MNIRLTFVLLITLISMRSVNAQVERPFFNEVNEIDFGELLGLAGTCLLAYDTGQVTDGGGSLCPFPDDRFGTPGQYQIVATPNTNVEITIDQRLNMGDGISFIPDGVFQVFGETDTAITATVTQTVFSGSTGVITILLGGTLVSSITQSFNSNFAISVEDGITFNEIP